MANREVSIIVNTIDRSSKQFRHIGLAAESLKRELISVQGLAATALGGITAGVATKGLFDLNASVEQLTTSLKTVTGSAPAAQKSLAWIQEFAEDTPYKVKELAQEFIDLTNYGINAANELPILGDAASALSKSLNDATEMFADAIQFEFERLKEFGIRANQTKDEVTFTWMQNGQEMKRTVQKTATDVTNTLNDILSKYKGGMEAQSKTALGMLSTISDGMEQFALKATGEVFERLEGKIKETLDWMDRAAKDGTLNKWADKVAENINDIADAVETLCDEDHLPLIIGLGKTIFTIWAIGKLTSISRGLFEIAGAAGKFGNVLKTNTTVSLITTAAKTGELAAATKLLAAEFWAANGAAVAFGGVLVGSVATAVGSAMIYMDNLVSKAREAKREMANLANSKYSNTAINNRYDPKYMNAQEYNALFKAASDFGKTDPNWLASKYSQEQLGNIMSNLRGALSSQKQKREGTLGKLNYMFSDNEDLKMLQSGITSIGAALAISNKSLRTDDTRKFEGKTTSEDFTKWPKLSNGIPTSSSDGNSHSGGKNDAKARAEEIAKVNAELDDKIREMTLDTYQYNISQLLREAAKNEELGADKIKIARVVSLELKKLSQEQSKDIDEQLEREREDRDNAIQERVQAEIDRNRPILEQRRDLTDQLMQLTLSEKDYAIWALEQQNAEAQFLYANNLELWKQIYEKKMAEIKAKFPEEPKTWREAWDRGLKEHLTNMYSWSQGVTNIAKATAQGMEKSMSDFFFDAVTGKLHGLGDYVTSFLQSVARAIADFYAQQFTQQIIGGWITPANKSTPVQGMGDLKNLDRYALGGSVTGGVPIITNEVGQEAFASNDKKTIFLIPGAGPRLFVPPTDGEIIPANDIIWGDKQGALGRTFNPLGRDYFNRISSPQSTVSSSASSSALPQVEIHIHNETGQEMKVEKQETKMDGARMIMNLWLEGYARNLNGVQGIVKGAGY